jgi:hypothetical protein
MWSPIIAEQLRLRGHDVDAVAARNDLVKQPDFVVFAVAQREERVIVTEDLSHFQTLAHDVLSSGRSHAGLILTHPLTMFRGGPRSIGRAVSALSALLLSDVDLTDREIWLS